MLEIGGLDDSGEEGFGWPPRDRRGLRVGLKWTALEAVVGGGTVIIEDFIEDREGIEKVC